MDELTKKLIADYETGLSARQLSNIYGLSVSAVRGRLARAGVRMRTAAENAKSQTQSIAVYEPTPEEIKRETAKIREAHFRDMRSKRPTLKSQNGRVGGHYIATRIDGRRIKKAIR